MFAQEVIPIITEALAAMLIAIATLAAAHATVWFRGATAKLRAETIKIEDEDFRGIVQEALDLVDILATKTVAEIEQTTAEALRQAVKDGKADPSELAALGRQAVEEILTDLAPHYQEALLEAVADVECYVQKVVESKVYELKNSVLTATGIVEIA